MEDDEEEENCEILKGVCVGGIVNKRGKRDQRRESNTALEKCL